MARNQRKSKRPSAGPLVAPPDAPVFFVDRDTGGRLLAEALRPRGHRVELHDAHFPPDTGDSTWIRTVAARGWVVLTCDRNIARKEPEHSQFAAAPTRTFILYALSHMPREQRIKLVLEVLPKLCRLVSDGLEAGIYRVHTDGRVERVTRRQPRFRPEDL
jgi:hypothetical protein